ncbi:MAG TPA: pyrroline-5-carboxylate reductase dimerization domain-containing protein, partial [Ilumatobacteraceae bacterium]|nr:pyrroline-5-carboxylate reductase dimerization domain-containing protein [Ilumatobacteraceae bacterium]
IAEALIDAGVDAGLERPIADALVRQLFTGSAALLASGDDPADLRRRVTSPGGTTAAGIAVMEAGGVRELFAATVRAASERSRELGRA